MRSAMTPGRLTGAALDIATAAAERRPAGRNGCTSGRNRPRRANSNRGSGRARCSGHRSISFRDISRPRPAVLCSVRVEENPREVTPSGFNAGQGCAGALVRYHQNVKLRFTDCAFV
jgi:hypothetical protein